MLRKLLLGFLMVLCVLLAIGFYYLLRKVNTQSQKVLVVYDKNQNTQDQMQYWVDENKISAAGWLQFFARFKAFQSRFKTGAYHIKPGMSQWDILQMLRRGSQSEINLVIRSSWNKAQLAGYLSQKLFYDSLHYLEAFQDDSLLQRMQLSPDSLLAYIIPNTYRFYYQTDAENWLKRMMQEHQKWWTNERIKLADNQGLSPYQVATLASIIDKETAKSDEMPTIAGVYLNRLKVGMPLQADPTVLYAANAFGTQRVRGASLLQIESPYNTYKYSGLPPGPICIPSQQAIAAVLNPQKHRYLYFVAKADFSGYHLFNETLDGHNRDANKYRRELNKRGIY